MISRVLSLLILIVTISASNVFAQGKFDTSISTEGLDETPGRLTSHGYPSSDFDESIPQVQQSPMAFINGRYPQIRNETFGTMGTSDLQPSLDEYGRNELANTETIASTMQATKSSHVNRNVHDKKNRNFLLNEMRKSDGFARNFKEGASDDDSIAQLLSSFEKDDNAGNPYHLGAHGDYGFIKQGEFTRGTGGGGGNEQSQ